LTAKEQELLADTTAERLRGLDEDALIELHVRVRRARDKFVQLHRREVGQQVEIAGARGLASTPPRRSASKAEIFEQALARVSASLGRAARAHAAALRAERLDASRRAKRSTPHAAATISASPTATPGRQAARARTKAPVERKRVAAERASGQRRQAASDRAAGSR
jgi:hypothetical protein